MQTECVGCGATATGYIDGECADCAAIAARNALAAARDDVLRAARVGFRAWEHSAACARYEPRPEESTPECDCGLSDLCAAVDRLAKLEGM